MGTAATFLPFMHAFPPDRHILAIDLPGAGESDRNPQLSPHLGSISRCVHDVLEALYLPRPLLLGHSHGGAVALHMTASDPGRVSALVLLAPAHPYFRHADQLIAFYLSPLGKLFAHTLPWYPAWMQMAGLRRLAGPGRWETPERLLPYRTNLRTRGTIPFLLRLLQTWHADMGELRRLLQAPFPLPTLLLWGEHDRAVPASTAPDLSKHLRLAELEVLAGVGHRPAEERPELCAQLIQAWESRRDPVPLLAISEAEERLR